MHWRLTSFFLVVLLFFPLSGSWATQKRLSVPVGDSPTIGEADAPVTIIEFIDFQ